MYNADDATQILRNIAEKKYCDEAILYQTCLGKQCNTDMMAQATLTMNRSYNDTIQSNSRDDLFDEIIPLALLILDDNISSNAPFSIH